jgi:hypothetical protein
MNWFECPLWVKSRHAFGRVSGRLAVLIGRGIAVERGRRPS